MPSYVTPKKNTAFVFYVSLVSQSDTKTMQTNPTLAAGDVKVSIDGGALANLTTLPTVTPTGSAMVKVSLSAAEMNGDNITVVFKDAAGAEWADLTVNIQTTANQIDDLALASTLGTPAGADMSADIAAVKTDTAAILVDTADIQPKIGTPATNLSADIAAVQTDTNDIQTRLPAALVGGRMDSNVGAVGSNADVPTHLKNAVLGTCYGTVTTGATTTSIPTSALTPAGSATDQFKGRILVFDKNTTTAALRGQATDITASTASATPTFTVTALTTAPASGDTFSIQ